MVDGAPITVRYDVQNSDKVASETKKVETSLNALRTSAGQTGLSVKQMEAGFNANALGNFSNAITNADTKVGGFRTKLTQIGTAFSQNATSFGVATASIWGVYNAYDSLEKVQIRAHAAATRVSTLETTIATLTNRRTEAVAKGNLSAEEMAVLDERITNAHSKLAVAQERNADLQQDVNEAWAAFASQVGPQAIAAGGSIVQLITNLKGGMGGTIPAIKNFFGSFGGGGQIMAETKQQSLLLGQGIGNLKGPMEGAAIATRGLSTAMKGLLIGTGVGIAIAAIGLIAEHFSQAAEASTESSAEIQDSMDEIDGSFSSGGESVKAFGGAVFTTMNGVKFKVEETATKVKDTISKLGQELRTQFPDVTPQVLSADKTRIEGEIAALQAKRNALLAGTVKPDSGFRSAQTEAKSLEEQVKKLRAELDLDNATMKEMFGIVQSGEPAMANLGKTASQLGKDVQVGVKSLSDAFHLWQSGGIEGTGPDLAKRYELFKQGINNYTAGVKEAIPPTKEQQKAEEELQQAIETKLKSMVDEANKESEKRRVEQEALNIKKQIVQETFGEAAAAKQAGESNGDYANRMSELSDIGQKRIDEEKQYTLGLIATAESLGLNKTRQAELTAAMSEGNSALQALILSDSTLVNVMNDHQRALDLTDKGYTEGRIAAVAWYDQMIKQIAVDAQFADDQKLIAQHFADVIPAGIDLTKEQMTSLIVTMGDTGKYAETLGQVMDTVFSETNAAVKEVVDSAVKGGKDWKSEWKDIKDLFPKSLRDDIKGYTEDQANLTKELDEVTKKMGLYSDAWNNLNPEEQDRATKDMIDDIQKLGEALDKTSDVDIDATITGPLIDLAQNGLTEEEKNIWESFVNKYQELNKDGKIDDNDVKTLQNWVANHTGMKELGDATSDTSDAFKELTPEQQKLADNRKIKVAIDAVSGALELQRTDYVEPLTQAYKDLALAMLGVKTFGGGGGGKGGVSNVAFRTNPSSGQIVDDDGNVVGQGSKGGGNNVVFSADTSAFDTAVKHIRAEVTAIDALRPIVDFLGDHRQFVKAGNEVLKAVAQIDKLRPIVDFLGDHRQFMDAGADVVKVVNAIDALRPIVDFLGDHRQFMKAAAEVKAKVKEIDGMVATVTIKAKRVGNFSAQHGMHATLSDDAWIYAHKNERIDISPPSEHKSAFVPEGSGGGGKTVAGYGPIHIRAEIPLILGYDEVKKIVKDIYIENSGMFNT